MIMGAKELLGEFRRDRDPAQMLIFVAHREIAFRAFTFTALRTVFLAAGFLERPGVAT
jgi:hypothetical protein